MYNHLKFSHKLFLIKFSESKYSILSFWFWEKRYQQQIIKIIRYTSTFNNNLKSFKHFN